MVRATYWVCQKILWNNTTINLMRYLSDSDGKGDGGAGAVMGRLVGQATCPFDEDNNYARTTPTQTWMMTMAMEKCWGV